MHSAVAAFFLKAAFKIISLGPIIFYRETNLHLISLCFSGLAAIFPVCDNLATLQNTRGWGFMGPQGASVMETEASFNGH